MNRIKQYQLLFLTSGFMLFYGCDFLYGVSRTGYINHRLPKECVFQAIQSIPGIKNLKYEFREGSKPITLSGIQKSDEIHHFFYQYQELGGVLYFVVDYQGKTEIFNSYMYTNKKPPQKHIDILRPVMKEIELALETKCDLKSFASRIVEHCNGITCPPL